MSETITSERNPLYRVVQVRPPDSDELWLVQRKHGDFWYYVEYQGALLFYFHAGTFLSIEDFADVEKDGTLIDG